MPESTPVSIVVPSDALVMLVGPSGSGKSTFAARNFAPDAVLSSDSFRGLVAGDPSDQSVTDDAFRALHAAAEGRLKRGLITVIDATNLRFHARDPLLELARHHRRSSVAIVFQLPVTQCLAWNTARPGRLVRARVVRDQHRLSLWTSPRLEDEGFSARHILRSAEDVIRARVIVGP